jgi:non-haem Fe2+, alpha-ketoglutarate-dependent halogenase
VSVNVKPDEKITELAEHYLRYGYAAPLLIIPEDRARATLTAVREVMTRPGIAPAPGKEQSKGRLAALVGQGEASPVPFIECRHLDSRVIYDLCTAAPVLDFARGILGEDLLLWRSTIISKPTGGPAFRWHQDYGGVFGPREPYGLEPPLHLTVWLALTPVTVANGCLRFVPGAHHVLPSEPSGSGPRATLLTRPEFVDESNAIDVRLAPGEAAVFGDRALHASRPNTTDESRIALAIRLTIPQVRVRSHFLAHRNMLVSGRDSLGANPMAQQPDA